jgi:protocatechuate 3,4-dioxygenase alpha subunit
MSSVDGTRQRLPPTPGQTVGPFFAIALPYDGGQQLVAPHDPRAMLLHGHLYDGRGDPIPDGVIEIWQADERGEIPRAPGSLHRDGHTFTGLGRSPTDAAGHFQFYTVLPGISAEAPEKAPFIAVAVFGRGLNHKLHTRIYLPHYAELNAVDPFLAGLDEQERATLVAIRAGDGSLCHDIHLQGEKETVFLEFSER